LNCDDDGCGLGSRFTVRVSGGAPHLIRVGSKPGDLGGDGRLVVTKVADWTASLGDSYCLSAGNSVHPEGANMKAFGSTDASQNLLRLAADKLPPNQLGVFYYGVNRTLTPFGEGFRCVSGFTRRLNPAARSNAGGVADLLIDYQAPPASNEFLTGLTWNFQFWYRDPMGGPSGFNFTNGLALTFNRP
jgi:hypothetical protein